jgi:Tfp pilus assembly protein PilF
MRFAQMVSAALAGSSLLVGISSARATVPYPDYGEYQAEAYERYAAECVARMGFQAECARLLESAIDFDPKRASSHHALAWYYLRSGDHARALPEFANALRLDPRLSDALKGMGDAYAAEGKLTLAEEKYQQYLHAAPKDPMAYYNLAAISALRGDDTLAIERLKSAMKNGFEDFALVDQDPRWGRLKGDERLKALKPKQVDGKRGEPSDGGR